MGAFDGTQIISRLAEDGAGTLFMYISHGILVILAEVPQHHDRPHQPFQYYYISPQIDS